MLQRSLPVAWLLTWAALASASAGDGSRGELFGCLESNHDGIRSMVVLKPFAPVSENIQLSAVLSRDGDRLRITYKVMGDVQKVRIADARKIPGRKEGLWKTTCFELFVSPKGSSKYWEFNFSPSGDWNSYAFDGYRAGMRPESRISSAQIRREATTDGLFIYVDVDLSQIPELAGELESSIAAVIDTGQISYWAVKHAGDKPDFHLRESFVGKL